MTKAKDAVQLIQEALDELKIPATSEVKRVLAEMEQSLEEDKPEDKREVFLMKRFALANKLNLSPGDILSVELASVAVMTHQLHLDKDTMTWPERRQWLHEQLDTRLDQAVDEDKKLEAEQEKK